MRDVAVSTNEVIGVLTSGMEAILFNNLKLWRFFFGV